MSSRTVFNNQLTPGSTALVDGTVVFSQITRLCTDEERAEANARRAKSPNAKPINRNYTSLTIGNPQVRTLNPQMPTPLETYLRESCYNSSSRNFQGLAFNAMNKTTRLPIALVLNKATGQYEDTVLEHELAVGTKVTLKIRVFEANGNKGISLDAVLIDDLQYAVGGAMTRQITDDLAAYGITVNWSNGAAPQMAPQAPQVAPVQPAAPAPQGYVAPQAGYAAPQGYATPQAQVPPVASGNPFANGMAAPQGGFTANKTY